MADTLIRTVAEDGTLAREAAQQLLARVILQVGDDLLTIPDALRARPTGEMVSRAIAQAITDVLTAAQAHPNGSVDPKGIGWSGNADYGVEMYFDAGLGALVLDPGEARKFIVKHLSVSTDGLKDAYGLTLPVGAFFQDAKGLVRVASGNGLVGFTSADLADATGTGKGVLTAANPAAGRTALGAAQAGANADITSLAGLTGEARAAIVAPAQVVVGGVTRTVPDHIQAARDGAVADVRGGVASANDTLAKLAATVAVAAQGVFPAATLAQLNANATALQGTVDSDGANNGLYARTTRTDPSTPWVRVSTATVAGLSACLASTVSNGVVTAALSGLVAGGVPRAGATGAIGNPIATQAPLAAAAGSVLVEFGATFAGPATLTSIAINIRTLGDGQGSICLLSPQGVRHRIERMIPVTVSAAGVTTFVCGQDIPPLTVGAGWRIGWYAATGGALLGYEATGGTSRTISAAPSEGLLYALTSNAFVLYISASYVAVGDITYGRPLTDGTATPTGTVWVETGTLLPAGDIKQIPAYVKTLGNGAGNFLLYSPRGSQWKLEKVLPVTFSATGVVTLTAGVDFPAASCTDGWVLGYYAASGGASIAYGTGGGGGFLAVSGVTVGDVLTLGTTTAAFSWQVVITPASLASRAGQIERLLGPISDATASIQPVERTRDVVLSATASVAGSVVTVSGTLARGTSVVPFSGTVTLDAATTGTVTDEAMTIVPGGTRFTVAASNRTARANFSAAPVVKDAGSGATLSENADYLVSRDHGVIAMLGTGSRAILASYSWSMRRYDAITLDLETLALAVVKGTERDRDAAEFVPTLSSSKTARLFNARVISSRIDLVPTWDVELGVRRSVSDQFARDQARARRACAGAIARTNRGAAVGVASQGDSIVAIQSDVPSSSTPNGPTRDRATASGTATTYLRDALAADVVDAVPLYDTGDGAGQVHTRMSLVWTLIGEMQRTGATITHLNFGIAGSSSANGVTNPQRDAVRNSASDLVVVHYGQNELGSATTEANMRTLLDGLYAAGKEVVVVGPPRTNTNGGATDANWLLTVRALRRAAEYVDPVTGRFAAFLDPTLYYSDGNLGALGLTRMDCCQANLYNHPGIHEHRVAGRLLTRLLFG